MNWLWVALCISCVISCYGGPFRAQFPAFDQYALANGVDPGKPLFLTPYIAKGDLDTARKLSRVGPLSGTSVESYSGFLTVNSTYNSNLFFWFFPAQNGAKDAPLLLWLQGGPGGSSLFGLFAENGPFGVDKSGKLFPRKFAWTSKYSVLYVDQPVGTGFSFTDNDLGYATNEADVAENMYSALVQFMKLFPNLQKVDFYLTGESYAGKYIPAIAHKIHKEKGAQNVRLRGLAIGDGFTDPPVMIHAYAGFMYEVGLLDENQAAAFQDQVNVIGDLILMGKYGLAFKKMNEQYAYYVNKSGISDMYNYMRTQRWDLLLNGDLSGKPSFFTNATGSTNYFNFMLSKSPPEFDYYNQFLAQPAVRKAIHVGNLTYNSGQKVENFLIPDMLQSVKPWLAEAMEYYKVMLYSGQLDVIVGLPLTEAMLQTMPWSMLDEYKRAERLIWKVRPTDVEVAGYVRRVHQFYQVMVRGGGHILPADQPERSWDMIDRFITDRPFA